MAFGLHIDLIWKIRSHQVALRLIWSSGHLCGSLQSVLGLCSGRAQYSAQNPQRTAGERNTTPLSHLADVPVLLYSLPHSFPPSPLSLAQYLTHVLYEWGCGECFCTCATQTRGHLFQCTAKRMQEERWKWCRRLRKTKIDTQKRIARENVTEREKLCSE